MHPATTRDAGAPSRPGQTLKLDVLFSAGGKIYSYFWDPRKHLPEVRVGDRFSVIAYGDPTPVTVVGISKASPSDCFKYAASRLRLADSPSSRVRPAATNTLTTTETFDMIKIENQTLVNGRQFNDYSDHEILKLLRDTQKQIDTLSELKPIPKRFARKIVELEAGREKLIALLDEADAE